MPQVAHNLALKTSVLLMVLYSVFCVECSVDDLPLIHHLQLLAHAPNLPFDGLLVNEKEIVSVCKQGFRAACLTSECNSMQIHMLQGSGAKSDAVKSPRSCTSDVCRDQKQNQVIWKHFRDTLPHGDRLAIRSIVF
jgi:hypothetical protein